jgi:tetratricopeptide (TPR) repeat protein
VVIRRLLSGDDIDQLSSQAAAAANPALVRRRLVEAVDEDRIVKSDDVGYALLLAAEISHDLGELANALTLTERAIRAYQTTNLGGWSFASAYHAQLLHELGRTHEAMTEWVALRPILTLEPSAAASIGETLQGCGYAALAVQWLTEALAELRQGGARSTPELVQSLSGECQLISAHLPG